jgi:hypothetical protein
MTISKSLYAIIMIGPSALLLGCSENADASVQKEITESQKNESWQVRDVHCGKMLCEKATARLAFTNPLEKQIKIVRLVKSCNCASVQIEVGSRFYKIALNGRILGYKVESREFVRADHIAVRSGGTGILTVNLELRQAGIKRVSVDAITDSGENIGPVFVKAERTCAIWSEEGVVDLGEFAKRSSIPFTITFATADVRLFRNLAFRTRGYKMIAYEVDVQREGCLWYCKVYGFVSAGGGSGYIAGKIEVEGVDSDYLQRGTVLRGFRRL